MFDKKVEKFKIEILTLIAKNYEFLNDYQKETLVSTAIEQILCDMKYNKTIYDTYLYILYLLFVLVLMSFS